VPHNGGNYTTHLLETRGASSSGSFSMTASTPTAGSTRGTWRRSAGGWGTACRRRSRPPRRCSRLPPLRPAPVPSPAACSARRRSSR